MSQLDPRETRLLNTARANGVTVHVADLPGEMRGQYVADEQRIYLRRGMAPAQRVSALAHEVSHALRGDDGPQDQAVEDRVNEDAARLLITNGEYVEATSRVGDNVCDLAIELDVSPGIISAWQRLDTRVGNSATQVPLTPSRSAHHYKNRP